MTAQRHDTETMSWPMRPWLMATLCAAAGLLIWSLGSLSYSVTDSPWRLCVITFVAVAAVSFVITVERQRWSWALAFAAGWGGVIALVGWFTVRYNQNPTIFEWPFLAGMFAVLLAAPLFQTLRDEGSWRFPYARLHSHAWADAVLGAAALAFVGVAFLLALLISGLFQLIGIKFFWTLLNAGWFDWLLAGFAFGSAVGLLRERDALVATLQRLVMVVLSVLAPVLAAALTLFIASLPFTGLGILWRSSLSTTPLMLTAGAGAILLANAVIGNGRDDRASNRVLLVSAMALALAVFPLALIASVSLAARITQYGWTPERMWGVVAIGVALAYGLAGGWSVARGRKNFDDLLRPLQTRLALGVCTLAVLLALPIVDFGAISAQSQIARLASGRVPAERFDWRAMAFEFGPAGRERLGEIARSAALDQRRFAKIALAAKERYAVELDVQNAKWEAQSGGLIRVLPVGRQVTPALRSAIAGSYFCRGVPCAVTFVDNRRVVVVGSSGKGLNLQSTHFTLDDAGLWQPVYDLQQTGKAQLPTTTDVATAPVELRTVERKQLFVDGTPVGDAFP